MQHNRLRPLRRVAPAVFLPIFMLLASTSFAQQSFFNFNYPGPNNIPLNGSCAATLAGNIGTPQVTSTSGATITQSQFNMALSGFDLSAVFTGVQTLTIFWQVADNQGHTANFSFPINLIDLTKPVLNTAGIPATLTFNSVSQVPAPPTVTATDNCGGTTPVIFSETLRPPLCEGGTFLRTWTATDPSGNVSIFSQTVVIIKDASPPTITRAPVDGIAPCANVQAAYQAWLAAQMGDFQAVDPSGIASYSNDAPANFPPGCPAPLVVTFTATDSCGFSKTTTAQFVSFDNNPPTAQNPPQNRIVNCSSNQTAELAAWIQAHAGATATDACTPANQLRYRFKINGNSADSAAVQAAFAASILNGCGPQTIGNQQVQKVRSLVSVEVSAEDWCGNSTALGSATFAAIDTIAPVLSGPQTTFEECGGAVGDSVALANWLQNNGQLTATDGCSATVWGNFDWVTSDGKIGNGIAGQPATWPKVNFHDCNWFVNVTFHALDACGNDGQRNVRFQIRDTEPPVFASLQPLDTLFCPNLVPPTPTVSDNCDTLATITFTSQIATPPAVPGGEYQILVTWTATDDCGNTASATATFTVRDTIPPAFSKFPPDATIACGEVLPAPDLNLDVAATDSCGAVSQISFDETNDQNPDTTVCGHYNYLISRTFRAVDVQGNTATRIQTIAVRDTLAPAFAGFLDTLQTCDNIAALPAPTASGSCGKPVGAPVLASQIITAGTCPDAYTLTLTWTATDVCQNTGTFVQTVAVRDTSRPEFALVPPALNVSCEAVPLAVSPSATDNCDEDVDIVFAEIFTRNPDPTACEHWTNYGIQRTWTASDNCGNTRAATQFIAVQDGTAPVITCAADAIRPALPGQCGADIYPPVPLGVFDDCTSLKTSVALADTAAIVSSNPDPNDVPTDTLRLAFTAPNILPGQPATDTATLTLILEKADAEAAGEFFKIFDENGQQIGQTEPTTAQCGNGQTVLKIPAALLNSWFADGSTALVLAPNGTGSDAPNAICPGGRVLANLTYSVANQQVPLTLAFAVDGGSRQTWPPAASQFLDAGEHLVQYFAADCAGNESQCSLKIRVFDVEPPAVTAPAPMTAFVGQTDCAAAVALPFPSLADNCGFGEKFAGASDTLPLEFFNDANAGLVPKDLWLEIPGAVPSAVGTGKLLIRHRGDNADAGEFFRVFDENGQFLSTTTTATGGECTVFHESQITVDAQKINDWAADGTVRVRLVSNKNAGTFTDFISPCAPLLPDGTDGNSAAQAVLMYSFANVQFEISDAATGTLVKSGTLAGAQTATDLPAGNFTILYRVADAGGTPGEVNFPLTVRDTVRPTALCSATTIFTNPAGTTTYTLTPAEINGGSTDNCTPAAGLAFALSKSNFTCNDAGGHVPVTLTATDAAGNSASCTVPVRVETATFQPSFAPGVCEGSDVQLLANPPAAPGNVVFTYSWSGVGGFVSTAQNPVVSAATLANEGNYTVTVTGVTGCTATGTLNLDVLNLPLPALTADKTSLCENLDTALTLRTGAFGGQNVSYSWFSGLPGNEVLLGTTAAPEFKITGLPPGQQQFFVKINAFGCTSAPSAALAVTVFARPAASVLEPSISICAGETLAIGTAIQGVGIAYSWSGPNGFLSDLQLPPAIAPATPSNAGQYTLIIYQNGCPSLPAHVDVQVRPKPAAPQMAAVGPVCAGQPIQLTCNTLNAAEYVWLSPYFDTTVTQINALTLPAVTLADSGAWRVFVLQLGCESEVSAPVSVVIQPQPTVVALANSPVCEGGALQLQSSANASGVTYSWSGPSNFASFNQNPVADAVAGTYTVIASTSIGCADTATVAVAVSVAPKIAQVKFTTAWVNGVQGCVSGTNDLVLEAVLVQQNPLDTYHWAGPNGFVSNLPMPVLPNANQTMNGTYRLTVKNEHGCASLEKSVLVDLRDRPATPLLEAVPNVICAGENTEIRVLNANQYVGNQTVFNWSAPDGNTQTPTGVLQISNANAANQSGSYAVSVTVDGCPSLPSAAVGLTVNPAPTAPVISGDSPICAGATLQLNAPFDPTLQYSWSGPAGFTASIHNPTVPNIQMTQAGQYQLVVRKNGCSSLPSQPVEIVVKPVPPAPVAQNSGGVCLDAPGAVLTLNVLPGSATPLATYTWFDAATNQPLAAPTLALQLQIADLQSFAAGQAGFYATATLDGCTSVPSLPTTVSFFKIPTDPAFAGNNFTACDQNPLTLAGMAPAIGTGIWTQVSGPAATIVNPAAANATVANFAGGFNYAFAWTLSNGACANYASDTVAVYVSTLERANSIDKIDTCFAESVVLQAVAPLTTSGSWSQPSGQILLGIDILNPGVPAATVEGMEPGNTYFFYWTLADVGCGTSTDTTVVRSIGSEAFAGSDRSLCDAAGCDQLQAAKLDNFETGKWSAASPAVNFTNPNGEQTTVCGLAPGENLIFWTTNGGVCGAKSRDTLRIFFEQTPVPANDTLSVAYGHKTSFNVLLNDVLPTQFEVGVFAQPQHGTLEQTGEGAFTYQPDRLVYRVYNLNCDSSYGTATVIFEVTEPVGCAIPTIFTPNEDGVNDIFFIPCLEQDAQQDNEVTIFNINGDEVFHAKPYRNDWAGEFNGEPLPTGTYFFVVRFGDGAERSGFVLIQR
ncbi:MAG: gliding motility-associated C-terminal domain-containing protein [Saprospiraceae bacterium]